MQHVPSDWTTGTDEETMKNLHWLCPGAIGMVVNGSGVNHSLKSSGRDCKYL